MNEVGAGLAFLYAKLSSDTTLTSIATGGIHRGSAPQGTTGVWVTFDFQSGRDTLTVNVVRILSRPLYRVLAAGDARQMTNIANAANRIDDLLERTSGTVTGAKIDACYREEPLELNQDLPDGTKRSFLGGLFRCEIERA
jgi:hypothetical protein